MAPQDTVDTFALYVEKELVGKRVKSSKIKVTWKFAFRPSLETHEVQLKHSLVSGKREVLLNGVKIFNNKKTRTNVNKIPFNVDSKKLIVKIKNSDGKEGYLYDLLIDEIPFHNTMRISILGLEEMRSVVKERQRKLNEEKLQESESSENKKNNKKTEIRAEISKSRQQEKQEKENWKNVENTVKMQESGTKENENGFLYKGGNGAFPSIVEEKKDDDLLISFQDLTVESVPVSKPVHYSMPSSHNGYANYDGNAIMYQQPPQFTGDGYNYTPNSYQSEIGGTYPQAFQSLNKLAESPLPDPNLHVFCPELPSTPEPTRINLLDKNIDPFKALVNLDNLNDKTDIQKHNEKVERLQKRSSTSYRFKYGDIKPSARTIIDSPNQYTCPVQYSSPNQHGSAAPYSSPNMYAPQVQHNQYAPPDVVQYSPPNPFISPNRYAPFTEQYQY